MDCQQARAGLWPPERPKLVGEDVAAARAHIDGCAACREYLAQDRALLDAYDRLRDEKAPLHVRERVFDALARARWDDLSERRATERLTPGWRRLAGWPLLLAASIAAIVIGTSRPDVSQEAPAEGAMFVEDYLRRAVGQDHIVTSDPDEIGRFLARELGMQIRPIQFEGLELERAEICLLEGRRGAMIVYKTNGAAVSHYLVPSEASRPRSPALSDQRGGPGGQDFPVVTWATPQLEQALVGELSSEQLLRLAERGST